ncbi:MAG: sigma-70 family RNA polymerase sigma factor [Bacteroidota bacterium]
MTSYRNEHLGALSDTELVARYKFTLDKTYVGELFKRYSHLVLGLCINYYRDKDEAKDALLQIFEKLFDELRKRDVENFRPWLTFVARNHCISTLRKKKTERGRKEDFSYTGEKFVEYEDSLRQNEQEVRLQALEEAVKELDEEQRICVELFYLKEKSYNEIAAATGYSVKQVKSYLQNGKRNLRILLNTKNERIPK